MHFHFGVALDILAGEKQAAKLQLGQKLSFGFSARVDYSSMTSRGCVEVWISLERLIAQTLDLHHLTQRFELYKLWIFLNIVNFPFNTTSLLNKYNILRAMILGSNSVLAGKHCTVLAGDRRRPRAFLPPSILQIRTEEFLFVIVCSLMWSLFVLTSLLLAQASAFSIV